MTLRENVEIRRGDSEILDDEVRFNTRTGALSADSDAGAQTAGACRRPSVAMNKRL